MTQRFWLGLVAVSLGFALLACGGSTGGHPAADDRLARELGIDSDELEGDATWYGERHHGRTTASGEPFDMYDYTAAHKSLPFGTVVRVTRDDTLQSVVVRINDRGPYGAGRVIDLSRTAAEEINMIRAGVVPVHIEILELP
ncbi:MAG: septal ring lytic transglycosylase RlpA family protein [Myxococcales bacterium]|nr:septal ring lytic transglycosylase RlpA family protein [Myxococcales bacterium]